MEISSELIASLNTLIEENAALREEMKAAADLHASAQILAAAAAAKGFTVELGEIEQLMANSTAQSASLSMDELDQVTGGRAVFGGWAGPGLKYGASRGFEGISNA
jgi:hypothetical protein